MVVYEEIISLLKITKLLLGIYLKKIIIQKDTCPSTFIAAVFTIERTWKKPRCPSTEE